MPIFPFFPISIVAKTPSWNTKRGSMARTLFRPSTYLAMHTPFGGMVKGAHRDMLRKMDKASPKQIEADFDRRVMPGLTYCQRVGNIMGATTMLSLLSTIDHGDFQHAAENRLFLLWLRLLLRVLQRNCYPGITGSRARDAHRGKTG